MEFNRDEVLEIIQRMHKHLETVKYPDPCNYDWENEDAKDYAYEDFDDLVVALGFTVERDSMGDITSIY